MHISDWAALEKAEREFKPDSYELLFAGTMGIGGAVDAASVTVQFDRDERTIEQRLDDCVEQALGQSEMRNRRWQFHTFGEVSRSWLEFEMPVRDVRTYVYKPASHAYIRI